MFQAKIVLFILFLSFCMHLSPEALGKCLPRPGENVLDSRDFVLTYFEDLWFRCDEGEGSQEVALPSSSVSVELEALRELQKRLVASDFRGFNHADGSQYVGYDGQWDWMTEDNENYMPGEVVSLGVDGGNLWAVVSQNPGSDYRRYDLRLHQGQVVEQGLSLGSQGSLQRIDGVGMAFSWLMEGDKLVGTLEADSTGWLLIGFNDEPSLQGARLIMAAVSEGHVRLEEHVADPPRHEVYLGQTGLLLRDFEQSETYTSVTFEVDRLAGAVDLEGEQLMHLILAYSLNKDFSYHSHVRQGFDVVLARE